MPQYTEQFTEVHQPLSYLTYQVLSPGYHYTPYLAVNTFHRVFAHWFVGNMGNTAYMYVTFMEARDTAGTGAQWIPWYLTTAYQALGDVQTHHALELRTEQMTQGYDCIALEIFVATNPVEFTSWVWGVIPRYPIVPVTFWDEILNI